MSFLNKKPPFKLTKATLFITALAVMFTGFLLISDPSRRAVLADYSSRPKAVHRLAIAFHRAESICSTPSPHKARCLAEVSIGTNGRPLNGSPASSGAYGPTQFHTAYQLPCTPGGSVASVCATPSSFGPETIAIVDAGNFSSGAAGLITSLQDYDQFYGLPTCNQTNGCLNIVNQSGASSPLPADAGWSTEIALDVETAHMVCQTCKIVLVEGNDAYDTSLAAANATAATFNPVAISNSWGLSVDDSSLDSYFKYSNIAEVASTGDSGTVGNGASWPSDIPAVVSAAGSTLQINSDNTWASETVWSGSGGGCSTFYSAPSWQSSRSDWSANGCGSYRAFGDLAMDGDPSTGAAINISGTWYQVGGTSLSSPLIAGLFALVGNIPSSTTASSIPYTLDSSANFHDITSGSDCTGSIVVHCTAKTGFDTPSGLGSPNGLGGLAAVPEPVTSLTISSVSQNQVSLTWPASSSSSVTGYYIFRNGTQVGTVNSTTLSYTDSGLSLNTTYSYYVVAHDGSSNLSAPSITRSTMTALAEDINQDGHVDLLDLSLLASKWGQTTNLGRADINGDGRVDLLDLSLLASTYGTE